MKRNSFWQLSLSTLGAALGFFVLLAGIQFYIDLRSVLVDKEQMATSDFLVLHKKVGDMDMLGLSSTGFSQGEVEEIRQQPYIKEVGPITPGLFEVQASLQGVDAINMNTAMYFESVDDRFIDVKPELWQWKEGDQEIPIILPSILLESYNFGMAPSQGLPPITEKTLKLFHYDILIMGKNNEAKFKGIIAGFSDRINTILVPQDFLNWANQNFKYKKAEDPSQLVIEVDDITHPELARFLKEKNYETNYDKLKGSRIKSILDICLIVFLILGVIILWMAAMTFIQYAHLSILRVSYELKTVMAIGYHYTRPARLFLVLFAILNFTALVIALAGLIYFKGELTGYFDQYYFTVNEGLSNVTILTAAGSIFFMFTANVWSVFRLLKSLARALQ